MCEAMVPSRERPGVAIVVTSSADEGTPTGRSVATRLKNAGITIVTVGVADKVDRRELQAIASANRFAVFSRDFKWLIMDVPKIGMATCAAVSSKVPASTASPTMTTAPTTTTTMTTSTTVAAQPGCSASNVCFAIDESGSPRALRSQRIVDSVKKVVDDFNDLAPRSRYAAVAFSSSSRPMSGLRTNVHQFKKRVTNRPMGKQRASGSGLDRCRDVLAHRAGPKVTVLITYGNDQRGPYAADAAKRLKNAGIKVVVVGVSDGVNKHALKKVATADEFACFAKDFLWVLRHETGKIARGMCAVATSSSP